MSLVYRLSMLTDNFQYQSVPHKTCMNNEKKDQEICVTELDAIVAQ